MIGEVLSVIVEIVWAYLLPWRVVFCVTLALLIAVSLCWLTLDRSVRIDLLTVSAVAGLAAGITWQSCHRQSPRETSANR